MAARLPPPRPGRVPGAGHAHRRLGSAGASALRRHGRRLGIVTVRDLLTTFPRRYDDLREIVPIGRARHVVEARTLVTVRATVRSMRSQQTHRRRLQLTTAVLRGRDAARSRRSGSGAASSRASSGPASASWPAARSGIAAGRSQLDDPVFQRDDGASLLHAGRIVPVYGLTRGISRADAAHRDARGAGRASRATRSTCRPTIAASRADIARRPSRRRTSRPTSAQREAARERLAHDELLALQLGMVARRRQRRGQARARDAMRRRRARTTPACAAAIAAGLAAPRWAARSS